MLSYKNKRIIKSCMHIIKFPLFFLIDRLASKKRIAKKNEKTLAIVRLDAIGDYILFRNFIEILKKSEEYNLYKIILIGNSLWKPLSENLDKKFVNEFIWINRKKFLNNIFYRYRLLKKINKKNFEILISPVYSREFFIDSFIKSVNAKQKIGSDCDLNNIFKWQKKISDKYYTKIIPAKKEILFEFYRNKEFFEKILNKKIKLKKPSIKIKNENSKKNYIVIFPGAGAKFRRWSTKNFAEVANFLINKNRRIILLGAKNEDIFAKEIISYSKDKSKIKNLMGASLEETVSIIKDASLLISNETCSVHIAAAVDTPTLCISNGNHYGRFNPYPKEISNKIHYIYHPFIKRIANKKELKEKFGIISELDINEIKPLEVINKLKKLI